MSQIIQQVSADLKDAMRAKDKERTGALRMLRAAFIEAQKSGRGEVTDDDAVQILRRLYKQREDAAQTYDAGGRPELAEGERAEMVIIEGYLPKLADEATTLTWVKAAIAETGAADPKQIGRVMGAVMKAHKGEVDGKLARSLIAAELGG
ncbi:MAG: GatB/YqeY domain-containing protein [Alphaproteobacteria bacterium]|nr:GatB/YqeY domain-containing protein [Alphaproteobacteria bacterium]